jgi:hypothetical protein
MATIPEMTQRYTQLWRDAWDATPPHGGFTDLLTHVNCGVGLGPPISAGVDCAGSANTKRLISQFPIARVDKWDEIHRSDLRFHCGHLSCLLFLAVERSASSSQPPSTTTYGHGVRPSCLVLPV